MVARLQRWLVFGGIAAAIVWPALWWARSPLAACTGLAVLAFTHATVLAIEFVTTRRVSARDPLPRATRAQCLKAWMAESWIAPRVFCWLQPFRSHAVPDHLPQGGRRGAVLVHGFLCNRGFWTPWLRELRAADRAFVAVTLEPVLGSIDHYPATIDAAVVRVAEATGQAPVLICHSMGGLAARAWLRDFANRPGETRAHRIITLGTPHGGTWLARFARSLNGRQMRIAGAWLRQLDDACARTRVPFTCWYSNCDNVVFPISTATLAGADNRLADGLGHVEMAFDAALRRNALALLDD
jgi:pimeloyl-ACP methyl ester carboxylesterase